MTQTITSLRHSDGVTFYNKGRMNSLQFLTNMKGMQYTAKPFNQKVFVSGLPIMEVTFDTFEGMKAFITKRLNADLYAN